jgi:hypothetical protein
MGAGGRMDNGGEKGRGGDGSKALNAAGVFEQKEGVVDYGFCQFNFSDVLPAGRID